MRKRLMSHKILINRLTEKEEYSQNQLIKKASQLLQQLRLIQVVSGVKVRKFDILIHWGKIIIYQPYNHTALLVHLTREEDILVADRFRRMINNQCQRRGRIFSDLATHHLRSGMEDQELTLFRIHFPTKVVE